MPTDVPMFNLPAVSIYSEKRMERFAESYFDRLESVFMDRKMAMSLADHDALSAKFREFKIACEARRAEHATGIKLWSAWPSAN